MIKITIKVLDAGLLTTVQDLGRPGYQKDGVPLSGAMDPWSLRLANILVGNPESEAGLEMTLVGPTLRFQEDALISITGANLSPTINGKSVPMWRPVFIKRGNELQFHSSHHGCRAYLGMAGGINVPMVMGSKSTYLPAGLGGFYGRAIAVNDEIHKGKPTLFAKKWMASLKINMSNDLFQPVKWAVSSEALPEYSKEFILHITPGSETGYFTDDALKTFLTCRYKLSPQSNRMGYRLQGPILKQKHIENMFSSPVAIGTVQVPADGQPIILMADCQTTGGYPRIGHVIQADRRLLAQSKPGDSISFHPIALDEAHQRYFEQEKALHTIKQAIRMR